MIEFVSITLTKPKDSSVWELRVACEQGEDLLPIHLQRLTTVGDFVTSGPLSKAIAFIPEALKAMGIAEAGSEPAYPTQNLTKATSEMIKEALEEMPLEDYLKVKQFLEDKDLKAAPEANPELPNKYFNEAVNLHWSKKPEVNQEPMGDDYTLRQEASVKAIKHAIAHGPPDQTTK